MYTPLPVLWIYLKNNAIVITHDLAVAARAQMAYQLADGCLHPIDIRQGLA